jgi:hypothetical protein
VSLLKFFGAENFYTIYILLTMPKLTERQGVVDSLIPFAIGETVTESVADEILLLELSEAFNIPTPILREILSFNPANDVLHAVLSKQYITPRIPVPKSQHWAKRILQAGLPSTFVACLFWANKFTS